MEGVYAGLDVLDGGVGLDVGVDLVGKAGGIQLIGDLLGNAELQEVGVGADQGFAEAPGLDFGGDLFDGPFAVVGGLVEDETVCHV